jgi:hypothetical protein
MYATSEAMARGAEWVAATLRHWPWCSPYIRDQRPAAVAEQVESMTGGQLSPDVTVLTVRGGRSFLEPVEAPRPVLGV